MTAWFFSLGRCRPDHSNSIHLGTGWRGAATLGFGGLYAGGVVSAARVAWWHFVEHIRLHW